jgi:hypothetical protein
MPSVTEWCHHGAFVARFVRLSVDGGTQDFLSADQRQLCDLTAQLFPRPVAFLLDLGLRSDLYALGFTAGRDLGFVNDLAGASVGGFDNPGGLFLGLLQTLYRFFLGEFQVMAGLICCRETLRDLFFTLMHGCQNRGPDVLHAEDDKSHKRQHLTDEGKVNIQNLLLAKTRRRPWPSWNY